MFGNSLFSFIHSIEPKVQSSTRIGFVAVVAIVGVAFVCVVHTIYTSSHGTGDEVEEF